MKFIALKTDDGKTKGRISFYCKALGVSRQSFYDYLNNEDKPFDGNISKKFKKIVSSGIDNFRNRILKKVLTSVAMYAILFIVATSVIALNKKFYVP